MSKDKIETKKERKNIWRSYLKAIGSDKNKKINGCKKEAKEELKNG